MKNATRLLVKQHHWPSPPEIILILSLKYVSSSGLSPDVKIRSWNSFNDEIFNLTRIDTWLISRQTENDIPNFNENARSQKLLYVSGQAATLST